MALDLLITINIFINFARPTVQWSLSYDLIIIKNKKFLLNVVNNFNLNKKIPSLFELL